MGITQEVLDYLGAMSEVRAATGLLAFEGSIAMGDYQWNGTVWGLDFEGADLRFRYGGGDLEGEACPQWSLHTGFQKILCAGMGEDGRKGEKHAGKEDDGGGA